MLLIFSHHPLQPTEKILPQPHTREGKEECQGYFRDDLPPEVGIVVEKIAGVERKKKDEQNKRRHAGKDTKG